MRTKKQDYIIIDLEYYDNNIGSFISQDPIRLLGGKCLYNYVCNINSQIDIYGLLKKGEQPIQPYEVTTYNEFRRKSVKGDGLEGHELLQNIVLEKEGLASTRFSTDASKNNPVIALPESIHTEVSAKQIALDTKNMSPMDNIKTNAQILRDAGVPLDIVDNLENKAIAHAKNNGLH